MERHEAIKDAVRVILKNVGEDPEREGLLETPRRVAAMYDELFSGLKLDPSRHLDVVFDESHTELVVLKEIPFYSMCEHHLMPFMGKAHVGYLPNGKIVGLSKLARVVEEFARRPQVQERLTSQIADLLMTKLDARGVAVLIEATHTCMTMRGIQKPGSVMVTSALRGLFIEDHAARDEVMSHFYHKHTL